MATLLNTEWKVKAKTGNSPFAVGETLKLIIDPGPPSVLKVLRNGADHTTGTYLSTRDMVKAYSPVGDEYWEFMLSEPVTVIIDPSGTRGPKSVLYGISWKNSRPDAMGSWVCDPQT